VDEQAWVEENAARLRETLASQQVRAALAALLGADGRAQARERRLQAARAELDGLELRWTIGEDAWV
jgi:hypothetical protein